VYNIITPKFGGASAPPSTYLSTVLKYYAQLYVHMRHCPNNTLN